MIKLLINLNDNSEIVVDGLRKGSVNEIIEAAKLLFPAWTSMELILVKDTQPERK